MDPEPSTRMNFFGHNNTTIVKDIAIVKIVALVYLKLNLEVILLRARLQNFCVEMIIIKNKINDKTLIQYPVSISDLMGLINTCNPAGTF